METTVVDAQIVQETDNNNLPKVKTINLTPYDKTKEVLAEELSKYANLVVTPKTLTESRKVTAKLRSMKSEIEKTSKANFRVIEDTQKSLKQLNKDRKQELFEEIDKVLNPIDSKIKDIELKKKQEKERKDREERERKERIQREIKTILDGWTNRLISVHNSEQAQLLVNDIKGYEFNEARGWDEYLVQAQIERSAKLSTAETKFNDFKKAEDNAAEAKRIDNLWRSRLEKLEGAGWNGQEAFDAITGDVIITYDNMITISDDEFKTISEKHNLVVSERKKETERQEQERKEDELNEARSNYFLIFREEAPQELTTQQIKDAIAVESKRLGDERAEKQRVLNEARRAYFDAFKKEAPQDLTADKLKELTSAEIKRQKDQKTYDDAAQNYVDVFGIYPPEIISAEELDAMVTQEKKRLKDEADQKAERDRLAAIEALKPDKDKLLSFLENIVIPESPQLESQSANDTLFTFKEELNKLIEETKWFTQNNFDDNGDLNDK